MMKRTVGVLLFSGFETLDVFGPLEMFGRLADYFEIIMIAQERGLIRSSQGQSVLCDNDFSTDIKLDILLIPGGMGTRREVNNQLLLDWIVLKSHSAELVLSVCTGAALLAKAGVLDGHRATTNKIAFDWVTTQSNSVEWVKSARWVEDGNKITSSGVSAGIDMSLYVIARLCGVEVRDRIAKETEYIMHSDANDDPFAKI